MATKEHSRYKTLLTMQTSSDVSLCPPGSDVEPPFPGLHLGLELMLVPLLGLEAQLGTGVGIMPHLRLWTL
jgi:hypothetical protein